MTSEKSPKNSNYQRLVVYLHNYERKKDFHTTHTFYHVPSETEAIATIWTMFAAPTDNSHDLSRKIRKIVYQGRELQITTESAQTRNGWLVK